MLCLVKHRKHRSSTGRKDPPRHSPPVQRPRAQSRGKTPHWDTVRGVGVSPQPSSPSRWTEVLRDGWAGWDCSQRVPARPGGSATFPPITANRRYPISGVTTAKFSGKSPPAACEPRNGDVLPSVLALLHQGGPCTTCRGTGVHRPKPHCWGGCKIPWTGRHWAGASPPGAVRVGP